MQASYGTRTNPRQEAPKQAFPDARGTGIIFGGLALLYLAMMAFDLGQGSTMAAMAAWFGVLLLAFGRPSHVHVLAGLSLVAEGLVLLLTVHSADVVLVLFGLGSIVCGLAEHADDMRRWRPRPESGNGALRETR